jgi:hypothetical protein
MLTREQLRKTEQWQALNAIWQVLSPQQRSAITPQFQLLSDYIRTSVAPPRDFAAEDGDYQSQLGADARLFARSREAEGMNVYDGLMKLVRRSTFESPEKVLFFFELKYGKKYPWVEENRDELAELIDLVWRRSLERGFVPGEGFPRR